MIKKTITLALNLTVGIMLFSGVLFAFNNNAPETCEVAEVTQTQIQTHSHSTSVITTLVKVLY